MTTVNVYKQDGTQSGQVELNDAIFAIEPNENAVYETIIWQQASLRQGTHAVKSRGEVRGGGRKPWRQKGTGRARQGSIRSPQWVGGGQAFGPTPRSYKYRLPRKVRQLALRSALSDKVAKGNFVVVDEFNFDKPKTQAFKQALNSLNANVKALVVLSSDEENAALSARNLPNVTVVDQNNVNVYDLVNNEKVVISQAALSKVEEVLA